MSEHEENAGRDTPVEPGGDKLPSDKTGEGVGDLPTDTDRGEEAPSGGAASSGTSSGQP